MTVTYDFEPKFSGFHDLMNFRVREILLVSSLYDAFVLEEDGRLAERIFSEYIDLNLHFIPRITKVSTAEEAFTVLKSQSFDLIITMARIADMNPIDFGKEVKKLDPDKMVILLSYDIIDPVLLDSIRKEKTIDRVFYWSGESKLLLAIIKYVEDFKNVDKDSQVGVQVILIVEDSPKYYSIFLPTVYTEIMMQTRNLIADGVNNLHRMLRMRARPKILLADSYEEALTIFNQYKHKLLGIISDIRFLRKDILDEEAGYKLAKKVKTEVTDLPVLLQSSETKNKEKAENIGAAFINKNSPNLILELRSFMLSNFGFGDFIFRYPDKREICRVKNLSEMEKTIPKVPAESLDFHAKRNHISIWLRARTEFELADEIRPKQVSDFPDIEGLRNYIHKAIKNLLISMQKGIIKDFEASNIFTDNTFIRLGSGSLGGKGRGIAFVNSMLAMTPTYDYYENIEIKTPQTFVIGTEIYEEFLEINNLQEFAINTSDEEVIVNRFLQAQIPKRLDKDLRRLINTVNFPLAIRSSSLLEDSQKLPFAGLYKTYMLPNNHPDVKVRLQQLTDAICLIYASVFFKAPKEYVRSANFRIEEEKMAVIIQQCIGEKYNNLFYPVISGVAQSFNYYPISHMQPDEGLVHLALGLGKIIVDGERIYRFSPNYPQMNLPFSSVQDFINNSQNTFIALDVSQKAFKLKKDEYFNLKKLDISRAEKDGTLFFVGSTYSAQNETIQDSLTMNGPRVITFANILKYNIFPLAQIVKDLLNQLKSAFGSHVEMEFAINLFRGNKKKAEFYVLQIRPMVATGENAEVAFDSAQPDDYVCYSSHAIGNGVMSNISNLIYLDPASFDVSKSHVIASELERINNRFVEENLYYILMGFGRWGTADPWLGIPVEWHQISQAKVLIESNLDNFKVEPSLGSHFFHNVVSLRLGYLHIKGTREGEFINWEWIKKIRPYRKTHFLRHLRFKKPLIVKIDGRSSRGAVFKTNYSVR